MKRDRRDPPSDPTLCRRCRHYFVTWDRRFPHGCRALDFKSKTMPCVEVVAASGMPCEVFAQKKGEA
ncbi:MAG: uracil-DNA glycosylase [Deltaproteobacteria bacterium]|nr:uracil-DNA glycosylase [Deltaproteobacteria bacterium]